MVNRGVKTLFSRHHRHRQQRPTKFSACSKQRRHRRVSGRVLQARHSRTVNRPRRHDGGARTRNYTNSNHQHNNIIILIILKYQRRKIPLVINKLQSTDVGWRRTVRDGRRRRGEREPTNAKRRTRTITAP